MKKYKTWQIVLMVVFFPYTLIYFGIIGFVNSFKGSPSSKTDNSNRQIQALEAELAETKRQLQASSFKVSIPQSVPQLNEQVTNLYQQIEKLQKKQGTELKKLNRIIELYKSIVYCVDTFQSTEQPFSLYRLPDATVLEVEQLSPSVILNLHSMDVPELRKAYKENEKQIQSVLDAYTNRYSTKANRAIYQLMVIALKAELQNILTSLKYEKLDDAIVKVHEVTVKYLMIASDGNQSISSTLSKFIGQVEYLFTNAVKIEYNYYVKKEQARQEQLAIREQMRLEAQERKALELEKSKIEKEENKYKDEIKKLEALLLTATGEEAENIEKRKAELNIQLSEVIFKKDEITKLQNGKAGNIYIISNLGSFGENVFKVGMTRRSDPQERVNELGDASVPFKFDVHSFIFSEDAVELETKLHKILESKRVNKVNRRKEFFNISIDELEALVHSIDPTAEFSKTMIADEYRQSLSTDEVYTTDYVCAFDEE